MKNSSILSIMIICLFLNPKQLIAQTTTNIATTTSSNSNTGASNTGTSSITSVSNSIGASSNTTKVVTSTTTTTSLNSATYYVVMKFSQPYNSSYANLSSAPSLQFILTYTAFINNSLGANAPNTITVTNLFSGSTGVSSTFVYSTASATPSISTITTAITNAASSSSYAASLGGFVSGSLSVATSRCPKIVPSAYLTISIALLSLFYHFK